MLVELLSGNAELVTATTRFRTPKKIVRKAPMKITAWRKGLWHADKWLL